MNGPDPTQAVCSALGTNHQDSVSSMAISLSPCLTTWSHPPDSCLQTFVLTTPLTPLSFCWAYISHFLPVVLKASIRKVLEDPVPAAGCGEGSAPGPSPWPVMVVFSPCACLGAAVSRDTEMGPTLAASV